jgi:hypothetical protein
MPLVRAKIIARIRATHSSDYGTLTWDWVLRADGRVSYKLTAVSGKRERNPWTPATQLTSTQLQLARDDRHEAHALLMRLVRQQGQQRSDHQR